MKLPYRKNAIVKREKLIDYLLSLTHPDGKSKAKFFKSIGYQESNRAELEQALLKIGRSNKVAAVDKTKAKFAINYTIYGVIDGPKGKQYNLKTVWAINKGSKIPHLVTAHPSV